MYAIAGAVAALMLGACGGDDDEPAAGPDPAPPAEQSGAYSGGVQAQQQGSGGGSEEAKAPGTKVVVADSQFGPILFDAEKQAIYLFDREASDQSECYGACADAWPPVLTDGEPEPGAGTDAKLLGTTERDDGSTQVTYAGHPLYYYAHEGPGQVLCHNVDEFGGLWLVVEPGGDAVS